MSSTPLLHAIEVRFIGSTATKIPRISLKSLYFTKGNQAHPFTWPYDHAGRYWLDQAVEALRTAGFEIIGVAEGADCYYIITSIFKPLTGES